MRAASRKHLRGRWAVTYSSREISAASWTFGGGMLSKGLGQRREQPSDLSSGRSSPVRTEGTLERHARLRDWRSRTLRPSGWGWWWIPKRQGTWDHRSFIADRPAVASRVGILFAVKRDGANGNPICVCPGGRCHVAQQHGAQMATASPPTPAGGTSGNGRRRYGLGARRIGFGWRRGQS